MESKAQNVLDGNVMSIGHHLAKMNAFIMNPGSPYCPKPDSVINNMLRNGCLVVPVWAIWIMMINPGHDPETQASVVLNHINWCTSHLLTQRVPLPSGYPGWLCLMSDGVSTKGADT